MRSFIPTAVLCLIMLGYQAARSQQQPASPKVESESKVAAATYEHLATAIIAIEATEDELVKGILIGYQWAAQGRLTNAEVPGPVLRQRPWRPPRTATWPLQRALDTGLLSARGYDRVLRVAWTIADLDGRDSPDAGDIGEALSLRTGRMP